MEYIQALMEIADATPADAYLRLTRAAGKVHRHHGAELGATLLEDA